jgi:hypothetical protein
MIDQYFPNNIPEWRKNKKTPTIDYSRYMSPEEADELHRRTKLLENKNAATSSEKDFLEKRLTEEIKNNQTLKEIIQRYEQIMLTLELAGRQRIEPKNNDNGSFNGKPHRQAFR